MVTNARMSPAEYLEWERQQLDKHEYHWGEVLEVPVKNLLHNFLSAAMVAELGAALRGKQCYVFSPAQRISLDQGQRFVYADAVVQCKGVGGGFSGDDNLVNPSIIVEVLSPSTESYDRGQKWEAYQKIATLTDYVLVSQSSARIEHFIRQADGSWSYRAYQAGDTMTLANGAQLQLDAIYEGAFDLEAG